MSEHSFENLESTLADIARWLSSSKAPAAIVGGVAASLLGRSRFTRDIDLIVILPEPEWSTFMQAGRAFGFEPRVANPLEFARRSRMLLMTHQPSSIDVDISLGWLAFEQEMVAQAVTHRVATIDLRVARAEDIVIMKALARRPRDVSDIEGLLDANPGLNLERVRQYVAEMSRELDTPEIEADFEQILKQRAAKRAE